MHKFTQSRIKIVLYLLLFCLNDKLLLFTYCLFFSDRNIASVRCFASINVHIKYVIKRFHVVCFIKNKLFRFYANISKSIKIV